MQILNYRMNGKSICIMLWTRASLIKGLLCFKFIMFGNAEFYVYVMCPMLITEIVSPPEIKGSIFF